MNTLRKTPRRSSDIARLRPASRLAAVLAAGLLIGAPAAMAQPADPEKRHAAKPALLCRLQVAAPAAPGGPVLLTMTLSNPGAQALHVLTWNTPFEGAWWGASVQLWHQGRKLPYRGPSAKRAAPSSDQYLLVPAGGSREARLDLALPFDLKAAGRYELRPQFVLHDVRAGAPDAAAERITVPLACPVIKFRLGPTNK
jgi:hypothetical protein